MKPYSRKILDRERAYWESHTEFEWLSERGIQAVLDVIPPVRGDVLGLCSGSGMFPKRIPVEHNRYFSLDLSQSMLKKQYEMIPKIYPVVGNAMHPSFLSSSIDMVLVFAGLHHLPNVKIAIQNSYRILRPGGQFIAFEPNADCWYRKPMLWLKKYLNLYTEDERFLFPEAVKDDMKDVGFRENKIQYLTPEYNPDHLNTSFNKVLSIFVKIAAQINQGPNWQSFFVIVGKK